MTESAKNPAAQAEGDLRIAMALNRGMEYLQNVQKTAPESGKINGANLPDHIIGLYTGIHEALFKDWHGNVSTSSAERIEESGKRHQLQEIISDVLFVQDGNTKDNSYKLFDQNGHVIVHEKEQHEKCFDKNGHEIEYEREKFAEILAKLYEKILELRPYEYGTKLTTDFFITALSKFPPVKESYPYEVDFRRIDGKSLEVLNSNTPSYAQLKQAFLDATDNTRDGKIALSNSPKNSFIPWPNHSIKIGSVKFLEHEFEDKKCLVTVNGGLVELTEELRKKIEAHFSKNGLIDELAPIPKQKVIGYLPGTEFLHKKPDIDGIEVKADTVPLLCLDANILTGLSDSTHKEVANLIKLVDGEKAEVTNLNKGENDSRSKGEFLAKYFERANGDDRLKRALGIAYDHINVNVKRMDAFVLNELNKNIEGKEEKVSPVDNPNLYISMGGPGSGKGSVENLVQNQCHGNYVRASLDDFREASDLHKVLVAADHHADDYNLINPYATALRDWLTKEALKKKYNILYDGTGVDYEPRYRDIAKEAKENGFHTQIAAIEANLPKALERVKERFNKGKGEKKRTLPWRVVVEKHILFPRSFLAATKDINIDKVFLLAADGSTKNDDFIIAESFDKPRSEVGVETLKTQRMSGLKHILQQLLNGKDSILGSLPDFTNSNPQFTDDNTSLLTYRNIGKHGDELVDRVLAIYNVKKFNEMLGKGVMNPHASSIDGLNFIPNNASFVMRVNKQPVSVGNDHVKLLTNGASASAESLAR